MCSLVSVIALKSDYIYKANTIYSNLKEYEQIYYKEAFVLNYAKCCLVQNVELSDYYVNGINVSVFKNNNGYDLFFDGYKISIYLYEKQIIDYYFSKA